MLLKHVGDMAQQSKVGRGLNCSWLWWGSGSTRGHQALCSPAFRCCPSLQAAVWARERAQRSEAEAAQRLQQQKQDAAAAERARAAAAAAAARRAQAGPHAGNAFAAVVQLARQAQERQAGPGSGAAVHSGSPARAKPKPATALPALQLQKLTERWHRAAVASVAAAGEQTARQRREAASRQQLRHQWAADAGRLPGEP